MERTFFVALLHMIKTDFVLPCTYIRAVNNQSMMAYRITSANSSDYMMGIHEGIQ